MFGNLDAFINPLKKVYIPVAIPSPIVSSPVVIPSPASPSDPVIPSPVIPSPVIPSPSSVIPSPVVSIHTVATPGDTMFSTLISEHTPIVLRIPQCTSISMTQTFSVSTDLQLHPTTIRLDSSTKVPQSELVSAALTNSIKWSQCEEGMLISYPLEAYLQYVQTTDPALYMVMIESGFQTIMTLNGDDSHTIISTCNGDRGQVPN